jgi:hypothetical protein
MRNNNKTAPSVQVTGAAKVKSTTATKNLNVTSDDSFHYFMRGEIGGPITAMNIGTALDLSNAIYNFFDGNDKIEMPVFQSLLFRLLKNAIGNKELDDNLEASLYVELCGNLQQLLNVCYQIRIDTNNISQ